MAHLYRCPETPEDQIISATGSMKQTASSRIDPIYAAGFHSRAFLEGRIGTPRPENVPESSPSRPSSSSFATSLMQGLPDAALKARLCTPKSELWSEFSSNLPGLTASLMQGLQNPSLEAWNCTPALGIRHESSPFGQSCLPELTSGICPPKGDTSPESSPSKRHFLSPPEQITEAGLGSICRKRRKIQQKRVVHVPIFGDGKQKGEAPPSDLWAWRKYGQKPIKGSPYPRNYYRCSSSKGCSARKQVERSRADPSTMVITYTADHNHLWPDSWNSSRGSTKVPPATVATTIPTVLKLEDSSQSQDGSAVCEPHENLFSCIINSPNTTDKQIVLPFDTMQLEDCSSLPEDEVDPCLSISDLQEEDFFDDLGELPELATIFRKGFLEEKSGDSRIESILVDGSDGNNFNWESNKLLLGNRGIC